MAVSAILTAASIAAQAASVISSFTQARKASKDLDAAKLAAEEFVAEAEKRLEVNEMERLAIAKEPYELQRQALLTQGTTALEAGRESERGAAATAGRIQAFMNEATRQGRADMAGRMEEIQGLVAGEASRLRDLGMGINLEQAAGAQLAAAEAEESRRAAIQQGLLSLGDLAGSLSSLPPLYEAEGKMARQLRRQMRQGNFSPKTVSSEQLQYLDALGIGGGNYSDAYKYLFERYQPQTTVEGE
jgi:hypothetical protein